jgi:hypothetical protein
MATSGGNPREIQDKDKKAGATNVQHPGMAGDAGVRVRTTKGWDSGAEDGKGAGTGQKNPDNKS